MNTRYLLWGLGGAALAGGIYWYYLRPASERAKTGDRILVRGFSGLQPVLPPGANPTTLTNIEMLVTGVSADSVLAVVRDSRYPQLEPFLNITPVEVPRNQIIDFA